MSYYPGNIVWVQHEDKAWEKATILKVDGKNLQVRLNDSSGEVLNVQAKDTEFHNESSGGKDYLTEDLTKLPDLHLPAVLDTLHQRFSHDIIYTYTGHILIALNPFKKIDGMYGSTVMDRYVNRDLGDYYEPHSYSTAHMAYLSMINSNGQNQSILVSGESGAGKTVTTKLVMDYLAAVSQYRSGGSDDSSRKLCNRILNTNPLLEAFGNAATLRNDNSSRFGKLIHLQFRPGHSALIGSKIDIYLLEQARIISQQEGERNFHIFYELAAGLTSAEKKEFLMPDLEDCRYTNRSERMTRSDVKDADQFKTTIAAMQAVGITKEEKDQICKIVIAVLHLGNVEFEETIENNEDGSKITADSSESVEKVCQLLKVASAHLERALCTRTVGAGMLPGTGVTSPLRIDQANESRDALAATIYHRLFLWISWRMNQGISVAKHTAQKRLSGDLKKLNQKLKGKLAASYHNDYSISCLDIFGFEVFDTNGFEQVCINYANEVLQSIFNEFVFTIEQKYYETEGIDWTHITFPDNHATIEMIEGSPIGLLRIIDEECLYPKGNDKSMHLKFQTNLVGKYSTFTVDPQTQKGHNLFTIHHFAGNVEYYVGGFHAKNKNELRQEAVDLIRSSADDVVKILLPQSAAEASGAGAAEEYFDKVALEATKLKQKGARKQIRVSIDRYRKRGQKIQQRTVSAHFKAQLSEAMGYIRASKPHFVRCIKPNDLNISDELDRPRTIEQLNYSGVLEAIRIARAGYTSRFQLKEFLSRFHCLRSKTKGRTKPKDECLLVLKTAKLVKFDDYQVGHTQVFLRADAFAKLEALKRDMLHDSVVLLQKNIRTWLFRLSIERRIEERRERLEAERLAREAEEQGKKVEAQPRKKKDPPKPPPKKKKKKPREEQLMQMQLYSDDEDEQELDGPIRIVPPAMQMQFGNSTQFNANELQMAARKVMDELWLFISPLLAGQQIDFQRMDVDPGVLLAVGGGLVLFLLMIISPVLFINVVVLGGMGYFGALQFRQRQIRIREKQRGPKRGGARGGNNRHRGGKNQAALMFSTSELREENWETASRDSYETQGTSKTRRSRNRRTKGGLKASQKKISTLPRPSSKRFKEKEKQGIKRTGSSRSLTKKQSHQSIKRTPSGRFQAV